MTTESKVREAIDALSSAAEQAEKTKEAGSQLTKLRSRLSGIVDMATDETMSNALRDALGSESVTSLRDLAENADKLRESVGKVTQGQTEDVKHVATSLEAILEYLEGKTEEKARETLARFYAAIPKRVRGDGAGSPDLGFTVRVVDEQSKETVASTTKKNLNSLRDQVRKHHEKNHGHKPVRGDEIHKGITAAIESVFGGSGQATGGGYMVVRSA